MIVIQLDEASPLDGATLVQTCVVCPTQYDVRLADGRELYFRYRSARWRLHLNGPAGPYVEGPRMSDRPGGDLDGYMTPGEVLDVLEAAVPLLLREVRP